MNSIFGNAAMAIAPISSSAVTSIRDQLDVKPKSGSSAAGSSKSSGSSRELLNEKEGAKVVDKAATTATKTFAELDSLRQDLAAATKEGAEISKEEIKDLNDRLAKVRKDIDKLASQSDLLSGKSAGVSVVSSSGDSLKVKSQPLDSKALGLDKLEITDSESLRKAAGKVALATGKTQNSVFELQAANGALKPQETNPGIEAFEKARIARQATPAPGSAAASVEQALSNQAAVNTLGYGNSGRAASTRTSSIIDLFG